MDLLERYKTEISCFPLGSKNYNFLKLLLKRFEPDFLEDSLRKEVNEAHGNLSESIQQYFKYHIIYDAALKAVNNEQRYQNELASCEGSSTQLDARHIEFFRLNMLKKYIPLEKSTEQLKVFQMCQTFLPEVLESKRKQQPDVLKLLAKLVEDNIAETCLKLAEYTTKRKCRLCDWEEVFDDAVKELSSKAFLVNSLSVKFEKNSSILQDLISVYYKELTEGMDILNKLINLFQGKLEFQCTLSHCYVLKISLLQLKMQCLKKDITSSTYNKDTVTVLKKIREELLDKKHSAEASLEYINSEVAKYEVLGPEYHALVEKYEKINDDIKKQKWAFECLNARPEYLA